MFSLLRDRIPVSFVLRARHRFLSTKTPPRGKPWTSFRTFFAATAVGTAASFSASLTGFSAVKTFAKEAKEEEEEEEEDDDEGYRGGSRIEGLPIYTKEEVAKHDGTAPDQTVWVIYKNGVYDITEFIESHPGGEKIKIAAGKSVEPFWRVFQQHMIGHVHKILEQHRIGNLDENDAHAIMGAIDPSDPYASDPWDQRQPIVDIRNKKPYCAEPPAELLLEAGNITPNDLMYTRCSLPVPDIEQDEYKLTVETPTGTKVYTYQELLERFEHHDVTATLQCIGNRAQAVKKTKQVGIFYGNAIGNIKWTGIRMRDVLIDCGVDPDLEHYGEHPLRFIKAEAADTDAAGEPFGGAVTMEKAISRTGDVLLAFQMNGKPIPRDHGHPIRLIVPGWAGYRNVKWLTKLVAQSDEPDQPFWNNSFNATGMYITEWPVSSFIMSPKKNAVVEADEDTISMKGWAFAGGGRRIERVQVSLDNGSSWEFADLKRPNQPMFRTWSWTHWEADLPIPDDHTGGPIQVMVRAVDCSFNTQPAEYTQCNIDYGIVNNRWHRVPIVLEDREPVVDIDEPVAGPEAGDHIMGNKGKKNADPTNWISVPMGSG